ncbi:MAG: sugar phosphate nucleotidyltransferase [Candidatus Eisenbacteria bacterium]|nr:sugar phosphate nucleotidyltransferase [Candidatus Eisenbacteria bacterium]
MSRVVAIVPAAGVGTRLRPHTHTIPKALINVAGRPILAHILDGLIGEGVEKVIVVVGYRGDRIRDYVGRRYGSAVEFVEQPEPLGLGHAVYLASERVGGGPIVIVLGDTIVHTDLSLFLSGEEIVLGVKEVEDPQRFGIVELDGDRKVRAMTEKPEHPTSNLALVGLYYLPESTRLFLALASLIEESRRTRGEFQLTDALQAILLEGATMRVHEVDGWFDCGKTETLLSTNRYLLDLLPSSPSIPGVVVNHPVSIDPSARVSQSIVGPYVSIAAGATVHGSILRNSIINESAEVCDVLLDGSVVGENAIVRGSFQVLNVGDSSEVILSGGEPSS